MKIAVVVRFVILARLFPFTHTQNQLENVLQPNMSDHLALSQCGRARGEDEGGYMFGNRSITV